MNSKTRFLLFSLLSCSLGLHAQTKIGYSYDAAGNRIKREIVMAKVQNSQMGKSVSCFDMVADRQIKISPNPTKGNLCVEVMNGDASVKGYVTVYSANGSKVASCPIINNVASVDISSSIDGVYILRVNIGDSTTNWKIIKE